MTTQYFLPGKALVHCNQVTSHFSCWQAKQMEPSISSWKAVFPCNFCGSLPSLIFSSAFSGWELPTISILYIQSVKVIFLLMLTLFPSCLQQGVKDVLDFCLFAAGLHRELALGCPEGSGWAGPIWEAWLWFGTLQQPRASPAQGQVRLTLCSRPPFYPAVPISPMSHWVQLQLHSDTSL